ncbi:GntR family transcriptional regulator [Brevundimonas sp. SORGH_AS_0993]|uniref:GntR family transcriptional regulator n=1 Tax=Brevundimonas sp. SORGH_AS_0993 TaxID=3041794 RepID=UPI00278582A1|nr:GntR family transcriptional regulator [Brevundimonas sp. SORGH_AS_0993]MDQ1155162.1 DNA-binding GntR family transcriptional regulator [Brevundimonas sp. SORGH_AS_0993]
MPRSKISTASASDPPGGEKSAGERGAGPLLAEKAYRAILQGLFDRTIPVGAELSQNELMRLLGLTIQPLRDALRTLETEGLVMIHARSCIQFVKADLELSRSTYQFRSLIERAGARTFAERGDAAEIAEMIAAHRSLIADLERHDLGPAEEDRLGLLEEQLHGALISSLRNPLIEMTARRLKNYVTLVRLDRLVTRPLALRTLREHLDILEACANRDADAAEAALAVHFQQALQRILGMA